jgi:DnaJ like chaperone protein
MGWWGKLIGGAFGFMLGGPLGALLGTAVGHGFDRGLKGAATATASEQERVQTAFFTATFAVMGHLAKVDGHVSRNEIQLAEAVMAQMDLTAEKRRTAINLFNEGKSADFPLDEVLDQFRQECRRRITLIQMFIEIQLQAAYADGTLHAAEERLLLRICDRLGYPVALFRRLEAMMRAERSWTGGPSGGPPPRQGPTLEDAYALLNLESGAGKTEVKRAYRRLMSQHHPDKLVAKGLPEEMVRIANQKTQEIRKAYEVIRKAEGW